MLEVPNPAQEPPIRPENSGDQDFDPTSYAIDIRNANRSKHRRFGFAYADSLSRNQLAGVLHEISPIKKRSEDHPYAPEVEARVSAVSTAIVEDMLRIGLITPNDPVELEDAQAKRHLEWLRDKIIKERMSNVVALRRVSQA